MNLEKVTSSDRSSLLSCDGDGCAPQSEILAISTLKGAPTDDRGDFRGGPQRRDRGQPDCNPPPFLRIVAC